MKTQILSLLVACAVLGCSSQPSQTHFYTLNDSNSITKNEKLDITKPLLLIEPISLSGYLRQNGIIVQKSQFEISVSNTHRWAERLETEIARSIQLSLLKNTDVYRIEIEANHRSKIPDLVLKLEINQFEIDNTHRRATVAGHYWLYDRDGILKSSRRFSNHENLTKNGFEHAVSKLKEVVIQLTSQILVDTTSLLPMDQSL